MYSVPIESRVYKIRYPDIHLPLKVLVISGKVINSSNELQPDDFIRKVISRYNYSIKYNIKIFDNNDLITNVHEVMCDMEYPDSSTRFYTYSEINGMPYYLDGDAIYRFFKSKNPYLRINHTLRNIEKNIRSWNIWETKQQNTKKATETLPTLLLIKGQVDEFDKLALQFTFGADNVYRLTQEVHSGFPKSSCVIKQPNVFPEGFEEHLTELSDYANEYINPPSISHEDRVKLYKNMISEIFHDNK